MGKRTGAFTLAISMLIAAAPAGAVGPAGSPASSEAAPPAASTAPSPSPVGPEGMRSTTCPEGGIEAGAEAIYARAAEELPIGAEIEAALDCLGVRVVPSTGYEGLDGSRVARFEVELVEQGFRSGTMIVLASLLDDLGDLGFRIGERRPTVELFGRGLRRMLDGRRPRPGAELFAALAAARGRLLDDGSEGLLGDRLLDPLQMLLMLRVIAPPDALAPVALATLAGTAVETAVEVGALVDWLSYLKDSSIVGQVQHGHAILCAHARMYGLALSVEPSGAEVWRRAPEAPGPYELRFTVRAAFRLPEELDDAARSLGCELPSGVFEGLHLRVDPAGEAERHGSLSLSGVTTGADGTASVTYTTLDDPAAPADRIPENRQVAAGGLTFRVLDISPEIPKTLAVQRLIFGRSRLGRIMSPIAGTAFAISWFGKGEDYRIDKAIDVRLGEVEMLIEYTGTKCGGAEGEWRIESHGVLRGYGGRAEIGGPLTVELDAQGQGTVEGRAHFKSRTEENEGRFRGEATFTDGVPPELDLRITTGGGQGYIYGFTEEGFPGPGSITFPLQVGDFC